MVQQQKQRQKQKRAREQEPEAELPAGSLAYDPEELGKVLDRAEQLLLADCT